MKHHAQFAFALLILLSSIRWIGAEESSFDSGGVTIHYTIQGQGDPVVLIHGFSASAASNWGSPGIIAGLAEDYQVIALDNRGHGLSGKPHDVEQYGLEMVQDAVRLLDHLKIARAHFVGYSMGGFITMKMLTLHPDRMITAVLGGAGWMQEGDGMGDLGEELAKSLEEGRGFGPLIEGLTPEGQPGPTEEEIQNINALLTFTNDTKALAAAIRGMAELAVEEKELKANKVPVLALIGEMDPLKAGVDAMEDVLSNFQVVVIDGADHMTAFTDPSFLEALRGFLAKHGLREATEAVSAR